MKIACRILIPVPETETELGRHYRTWEIDTKVDFVEIIMTILTTFN
jgi:hypothetical protein